MNAKPLTPAQGKQILELLDRVEVKGFTGARTLLQAGDAINAATQWMTPAPVAAPNPGPVTQKPSKKKKGRR